MNKKLDDMLQIYTKNLEKKPQNAVLLYNIGLIKFLKKEYEEATKHLQKALEFGFEGDYAQLGSMFYQMNELPSAQKAYEKALLKDSGEENIYVCLYEIYKKINDEKNLIKTLKNGAKNVKNASKMHKFLGNFYFDKKDYENALIEYKNIEEKSTDIFLSIANSYVMLDDIKSALQNYKKAYESAPQNATIMNLYNDALNEFFRRKND